MEWTETANDPHTPTKQRSTLKRLCRKTVHFVLPVFLACSILTSTTVYATGEKTMDVSISPVENLVYSGEAQNLMPSSVSIKDKDGQTDITGAAITYTVLTEKQDEVSSLSYSETSASKTNAGTYYVYYKATKDGYAPAYGDAVVTIQKKPVMLTWTIQDGTTQAYTENPISPPTASCSESGVTPTVKLTSPAGITDPPSDVGTYVYTATVNNPNYEITNPTCTVKITGQTITGYTLTPYGGEAGILFDAQEHDAGSLTKDDGATPDVQKKYQLDCGGWVDVMPKVRAVGTHYLKVRLTKTGFEEKVLESTVTILPVSYVTERCDYLAGWDLVLAYTNTDATFTYDGISMYELTSLGYQYGETQYAHVYGALVQGYGNVTLVTPSSLAAKSIGCVSGDNRFDVNQSEIADINDVVAVQAVYNIREEYFAEDKIPIVLRADVNGDKRVDTSDCNLIKGQ